MIWIYILGWVVAAPFIARSFYKAAWKPDVVDAWCGVLLGLTCGWLWPALPVAFAAEWIARRLTPFLQRTLYRGIK